MKKLFILLMVFFLPFITADVISLNSGGSGNVVLNSDEYIEGFFSCVPFTCSDFGYTCGTWSDGCGRTMNCGSCSSGYTCTGGSCVASPVTPPSGGGGGGGGGVTAGISVNPAEINIKMAINTVVEQVIKVTNLRTSSTTVSVRQQGLDNIVILGNATSLQLMAGEAKELTVRFAAPGTAGNYVGKILIGSKTVLVSLDVRTKLLLFDSQIIVLNENYKVPRGDNLKTQVNLIPMGDPERLDVTLNYVIKDYSGKTYLTQTETLLIEEETVFNRNFNTGGLPLGEYIVGLELVYPDGTAPSSAHFEVIARGPVKLKNITFFLIILILIVAILLVLILINRQRQKKKVEVPVI